jgi:hypothetical protein
MRFAPRVHSSVSAANCSTRAAGDLGLDDEHPRVEQQFHPVVKASNVGVGDLGAVLVRALVVGAPP